MLQAVGGSSDATPAAGDALAVEVALVWLEQNQALLRELLPLVELATGAAAGARLEQLYVDLQVRLCAQGNMWRERPFSSRASSVPSSESVVSCRRARSTRRSGWPRWPRSCTSVWRRSRGSTRGSRTRSSRRSPTARCSTTRAPSARTTRRAARRPHILLSDILYCTVHVVYEWR